MKHLIVVFFALLIAFTVNVQAEQHVAIVKNVSKQVDIGRDGSDIAAEEGLRLMNADVIITKLDSSIGIIFIDGTTITIGPDSEFRIKSYAFQPNVETYDFDVYLKKGSALFNSGKISRLAPESVNISTPRATVGIRGTRFIVEVR